MAENKMSLSKKDRQAVCFRHQFLQGSWNYERMQNGGWCYAMIPAIKKLYTNKDDQIAALKRHMEFYNTHPYVSAPVIGVTLPFYSAGGSSVLMLYICVGLVLSVYMHNTKSLFG